MIHKRAVHRVPTFPVSFKLLRVEGPLLLVVVVV